VASFKITQTKLEFASSLVTINVVCGQSVVITASETQVRVFPKLIGF
jgi:hypothetical protein